MKEMIKKMKERREGFTMAELLIVVAIIAVLVAIAIPVFTSQLERAREATDLANMRVAYAEVMTAALEEDESPTGTYTITYNEGTYTVKVPITQGTLGSWESANQSATIGNKTASSIITTTGNTVYNMSYNGTTWTIAGDNS